MAPIRSCSKIIVWLPLLTDHLSFTLNALGQALGVPVQVNVSRIEDKTRKEQGWTTATHGNLDVQLIQRNDRWSFMLRCPRKNASVVHLFGSPFEQMRIMIILMNALYSGHRVFLISEPYSPLTTGYLTDGNAGANWLRAKLRPLIYHIYGALTKRRLAGVFAISPRAIEQYRAMGIPAEKIFPFGYFVPTQPLITASHHSAHRSTLPHNTLRLIFVGNLIVRKGLSILIDSVHTLHAEGYPIQLDVFGPGDPSRFGLHDAHIFGARYAGQIPFGKAQEVITQYDLLVLPSLYDGWGVVINEALLAGVPVLCSNAVGAGSIIERWNCGMVYETQDTVTLTNTLRYLIDNPHARQHMQENIPQLRNRLLPDTAGHYMANVISGMHPANPWY